MGVTADSLEQGATFTAKSGVAIILAVMAVLFGMMLLGLFVGHMIFMCYCWKTTNESLKRSDKYNYAMRQFQTTRSSFGLVNCFQLLCCVKSRDSLITNRMVVDLYQQKIKYIREQQLMLWEAERALACDDQLATPEPPAPFDFEATYLQKIVDYAL